MMGIERRIVAIEVAGSEIRAALIRKSGRTVQVVDFTSLKRQNSNDDLPDIETIGKLAKRLDAEGTSAVYVTPMARACELFMDREKVTAMGDYDLHEAAKWEIETYTGISGNNALVGVEIEQKKKAQPGQVVYEDDSDEVMVNVSAMERNVFVAIKERFKAAGLKLVRIYPPDVSFFMPLFFDRLKSPRAILEIGEDYSNFAVVMGRYPDQINTLEITQEALRAEIDQGQRVPDLVETLKFTLGQVPEPEPLILTGPGAGDPDIVDYINGLCPTGAKPLGVAKTAGVKDTSADPENAAFGTVIGAGMREAKGNKFRRVGIDDSEPLMVKIRKNVYVMPLALTALVALFLLGHYQMMKIQEKRYKKDIETYSAKLKKKKADISKYEDLLTESERLETENAFSQQRINFINSRADKNLNFLMTCMKGISRSLPESMVLTSVTQAGATTYRVCGTSWDLDSVGLFATRIQEDDWCRAATIDMVKKEEKNTLYFELEVTTSPDGAAS